jgi:hypothetical protein
LTKIKVKSWTESTKEVDVDLPAYFTGSDTFDHGGGYDCAVRVNEDGKSAHYLSVSSDGEWQYHITSNIGQFFQIYSMYSRTTAEEFFKLIERIRSELPKAPQ